MKIKKRSDYLKIPKAAETIINLLTKNGYEAFVVGGCVRDYFLNKNFGDIDITTSALPLETEEVLISNNIKVIETGIQHGTVTAVVENENFEITTYRADGNYKDNRHPENVNFVSNIKEDLSRRDFTINAMAYNHDKGIIDLFGGYEDIKRRIIKTVGNPDERFKEDALRIMRAIRFSSTLGFEIEENTKKAIFKNKELLKNISKERLFTELIKLLMGDNVYNVLMEFKDVLAVIIPELIPTFDCTQKTSWHIYDVYEHIVKSVEYAPKKEVIRLTMFLHDIGKPVVKYVDKNGIEHFKTHAKAGSEIAKNILKRFKVSNKILDEVVTLIKYHQDIQNVDNINVKYWLSKIGEEYTKDLFVVRLSDLKAHNMKRVQKELDAISFSLDKIDKVIENNEPYRIKDLAINGFDLSNLGYKGKEIGDILDYVLNLVINDEIKNDKQEILTYLKLNK